MKLTFLPIALMLAGLFTNPEQTFARIVVHSRGNSSVVLGNSRGNESESSLYQVPRTGVFPEQVQGIGGVLPGMGMINPDPVPRVNPNPPQNEGNGNNSNPSGNQTSTNPAKPETTATPLSSNTNGGSTNAIESTQISGSKNIGGSKIDDHPKSPQIEFSEGEIVKATTEEEGGEIRVAGESAKAEEKEIQKSRAPEKGKAGGQGISFGATKSEAPALSPKSSETGQTSAPLSAEALSTSEDTWVGYMAKASLDGVIGQLKGNKSLRESLRKRLAELGKKENPTKQETELSKFMETALAAAEKTEHFSHLEPINSQDAFSLDPDDTRLGVNRLLAELEPETDPQFLPKESLFERISLAHHRSLKKKRL